MSGSFPYHQILESALTPRLETRDVNTSDLYIREIRADRFSLIQAPVKFQESIRSSPESLDDDFSARLFGYETVRSSRS